MKKLLKTAQVCDLLSLSQNKVLQMVNSGELKAVRLGPKTIRIYEESVNELLEKGAINAG